MRASVLVFTEFNSDFHFNEVTVITRMFLQHAGEKYVVQVRGLSRAL